MAQKTLLRLQALSGSLGNSASQNAFKIAYANGAADKSYLNFDTTNSTIEVGSNLAGNLVGVQLDGAISGAAFKNENNMASNSQTSLASQASIKAYVDSVAQGLIVKDSVRLASTANLNTAGGGTHTYNAGSGGSGGTITKGSNGVEQVDGQNVKLNDRILLKNQTQAHTNGIYTITTVGQVDTADEMEIGFGAGLPGDGQTFKFTPASIGAEQTITFSNSGDTDTPAASFSTNAATMAMQKANGSARSATELATAVAALLNSLSGYTGAATGDVVKLNADAYHVSNHRITRGTDTISGPQINIVNSSAAAAQVYTRAVDADGNAAVGGAAELKPGCFFFVTEGTQGDNGFVVSSDQDMPANNAATNVTFTQFSGAGNITAGDGLTKTGNTIDLDAALTTVTSIFATDIKIGEDDETKIDFEDANKINFYANNAKELVLEANKLTPGANDGIALGDASLGFSDLFLADAGTIQLGNDQDVTLTHVADTGILLNGAMMIQLGDAATNIKQVSDSNLEIEADGSIILDSPVIDLQDDAVSLRFGDDSDVTLTHVADTGLLLNSAMQIQFGDAASLIHQSADSHLQIKSDGSIILDAPIVDLEADGVVLAFGDDSDVKLTHIADVGLTLSHAASGDNTPIVLNLKSEEDAIIQDEVIGALRFTAGDSDGTDAIATAAGIEAIAEAAFSASTNPTSLSFKLGVSEAATEKMRLGSGGDLSLKVDGSSLFFGADSEIELRHVADDGLILKHVGTGDGKMPTFTFQAGDNDIAANDELGVINFQAPDEGAGTDAVLVAAGIAAVSEGDFAANNNATKLSFRTAISEAASEKATLSSTGVFNAVGGVQHGGQPLAVATFKEKSIVATEIDADALFQLPTSADNGIDFNVRFTNAGADDREVYVNGQLLLETTSGAQADGDWYPHNAANIKFDFDIEVGDVVQYVVRHKGS